MKAYPFHNGHKALIEFASERCENLHVIISHNKRQNIPGLDRYNAICETFKDYKNINVYQFEDDDLPEYDYQCETLDEFYSYWIPEIYKIVESLDVVFTSENYGDDFSKYLGVKHILYDKERKIIPISGTKIRENINENWDFITKEMQLKLIKRVALMGPESVGKSTLTKNLANYFNTNFVEEYGRIVYESNGNSISLKDFIPISKGRQSLEDWLIKKSNKIIFCDTEDITTYLFLKMFCDDYKEEEIWFLNTIKNKSKYDLYILLKPDCQAVQDGTREFLDNREQHYLDIKKSLIENNCKFIEIGGDWDNRFNESVEFIKTIFNI